MKNQIKLSLQILFFIFLSFSLSATTLDEIFSIALEASSQEPNVISGRTEVISAEAELSASRRARLPVFNASIINALTIDRQISDRNSLRKIEDEGLDARLQMVQPIFTGFRIQSDINRNRANLSSVTLQANQRFNKTIIEAISAYINYNYNINSTELLKSSLRRADEILNLEQQRFNAGLIDLNSYSQVKIKYSDLQLLYNRTQNLLLSSRAVFLRLFPDLELPSGSAISYRQYDYEYLISDKDSFDLESVKYQLLAAKADLLKANGARLPSIALEVSGTFYDVDGSDQDVDEYDIRGGLQASWQFLDFGANRKRVVSKKSLVNSLKYKIDYQRRIDEVEKLSLLSNIASLSQQLNEQYLVLEDLTNQSNIMEAQLISSNFSGVSLINLLTQKSLVQNTINQLENDYIVSNLNLKLLSQDLQDFIISRSIR